MVAPVAVAAAAIGAVAAEADAGVAALVVCWHTVALLRSVEEVRRQYGLIIITTRTRCHSKAFL